jgi:hypothetical protein
MVIPLTASLLTLVLTKQYILTDIKRYLHNHVNRHEDLVQPRTHDDHSFLLWSSTFYLQRTRLELRALVGVFRRYGVCDPEHDKVVVPGVPSPPTHVECVKTRRRHENTTLLGRTRVTTGNATGSRTVMCLYCEICILFRARGARFSLLGFLFDVHANSDGRTVTLA